MSPIKSKFITGPRSSLNKSKNKTRTKTQGQEQVSRTKLTITQKMDRQIGIIDICIYGLAQRLLTYLRNMNTTFGSYIMRRDNKI